VLVASIRERFEANVDRSGEHHLWCGYIAPDGTAQIRVNGRLTTARRVAWELTRGPLPHGVKVAGCVDEPRCVRVEHLAIGRRPSPTAAAPPRRRALRGAGSVQETRPGVWKVTIATANGRRARTVHGTRSDAQTALDKLHDDNDGPVASLNALTARYLAHAAASGRAPNTVRRSRELWRNWLAPTLGATRPHELHPAQVEATLTEMADQGLSASSVRQAASLLAHAYGWAEDAGLANHNPALVSRLPNGGRITIRRR
jgi:hypothetical protein